MNKSKEHKATINVDYNEIIWANGQPFYRGLMKLDSGYVGEFLTPIASKGILTDNKRPSVLENCSHSDLKEVSE